MESNEHEDSILYFSSLIESNLTTICDMLQSTHPDTVVFLQQHFGCGYSSPVRVSPRGFSKRVKRRFKLLRKTLPSSSNSNASNVYLEPDYYGQVILLKDLLREENENRKQIEASLQIAEGKLEELEALKSLCKCFEQ